MLSHERSSRPASRQATAAVVAARSMVCYTLKVWLPLTHATSPTALGMTRTMKEATVILASSCRDCGFEANAVLKPSNLNTLIGRQSLPDQRASSGSRSCLGTETACYGCAINAGQWAAGLLAAGELAL